MSHQGLEETPANNLLRQSRCRRTFTKSTEMPPVTLGTLRTRVIPCQALLTHSLPPTSDRHRHRAINMSLQATASLR